MRSDTGRPVCSTRGYYSFMCSQFIIFLFLDVSSLILSSLAVCFLPFASLDLPTATFVACSLVEIGS